MRRLMLIDAEGDLVGDGDAVAFEGHDFFRMVGQNTNVLEPEVDQDLRADSAFMLHQPLTRGRAVQLAARVNVNLRQYAWRLGGFNAKAAAGVMQVQKNTAFLFSNGFERALDKLVAIARCGTKHIAGEAV